MKQDGAWDSWFTTMVDFYRIPKDFPGFAASKDTGDRYERIRWLENKFKEDLGYPRFLPYIQLHEFESLLFADPSNFTLAFPGCDAQIAALCAIRDREANPELIDDGPETHPSKRIGDLLPQYVKPSAGPLIAKQIGLMVLQRECSHFAEWMQSLRSIVAA